MKNGAEKNRIRKYKINQLIILITILVRKIKRLKTYSERIECRKTKGLKRIIERIYRAIDLIICNNYIIWRTLHRN